MAVVPVLQEETMVIHVQAVDVKTFRVIIQIIKAKGLHGAVVHVRHRLEDQAATIIAQMAHMAAATTVGANSDC